MGTRRVSALDWTSGSATGRIMFMVGRFLIVQDK
jgi:hypothetical protein